MANARAMPVAYGFQPILPVSEEAEHIGHGIEPGLLASAPEGRTDGAVREQRPVGGPVCQFDPLAFAGKDHRVLADHGAATQRRKADVTALPRTGMPVAAPHRVLLEVDAASVRRRLAEEQGGAR